MWTWPSKIWATKNLLCDLCTFVIIHKWLFVEARENIKDNCSSSERKLLNLSTSFKQFSSNQYFEKPIRKVFIILFKGFISSHTCFVDICIYIKISLFQDNAGEKPNKKIIFDSESSDVSEDHEEDEIQLGHDNFNVRSNTGSVL